MKKQTQLTVALFAALTFGLFAACSGGSSSLQIRGLWKFGATNAKILVTEYENTGTKPIKAFKAKWMVYDDFDKVAADMEVEFTSGSKYLGADGKMGSGHVIAPSERIALVYMIINGSEEITYFTKPENMGKKLSMPEAEFADSQIKRKLGVEVEDIVSD
jgi:hypothetical protein